MEQLTVVCQTQKLAGEPSLVQIPVEGYLVVLDGLTLVLLTGGRTMATDFATPKESPIRDRHEFGPGIIREVSKYLYKNPKSAFKEACQ